MAFIPKLDYSIFKKRREMVIDFLRKDNPDLNLGMVVLFSDFENDKYVFRQESSFYYLTGITEPGAVLLMFLDGTQVLYLPNYGGIRERWTNTRVKIDENIDLLKKELYLDDIKYLGNPISSYSFSSVFTQNKYLNFLNDFKSFLDLQEKKEVFTLLDLELNSRYFSQIQTYKVLLDLFPILADITRDLAPLTHYLRRFKSEYEIDLIYKAVQITNIAHESAAQVINPGRFENEVQAIIESVFTQLGSSRPAFPSIIATGKNTTILHYTDRDKELNIGDLVVVDIGAEYGYYSADLTRTYPVSGKFTKEQLEIYDIVLKTQKYIESVAKPGLFINNNKVPEKSLNHLAKKHLDDLGYGKYFAHGIGHFLGLDVHDVGDNNYPLAPGDVFTIEPGIYIPESNLGIRIEDNYLMTNEGIVCLSFELPKKPEQIEKLMVNEF
ncbi:M24 family metallopeptidase [Candidatus Dependentiae bacterium]|nr:M24 family metallopeptidase [Candidatus Dependentiae bacterium]